MWSLAHREKCGHLLTRLCGLLTNKNVVFCSKTKNGHKNVVICSVHRKKVWLPSSTPIQSFSLDFGTFGNYVPPRPGSSQSSRASAPSPAVWSPSQLPAGCVLCPVSCVAGCIGPSANALLSIESLCLACYLVFLVCCSMCYLMC